MNKSKKNILYFSNHLRGPKGEAGARSWHQTKYLSEFYNLDVIIPAIDPVTSKKVTEETYSGLNFSAVTVHKIWTLENNRDSKLSRMLFFLSGMLSQFYKGLTTKKPNIVLCMSLPITLLLTALTVSKLRRVPFCVDLRDLPFETAAEIGYLKNSFLIRFLVAMETFCLRQATFILTNSPRYKPMLVERGIDPKKISIAPLGYDDFEPPSYEKVLEWREKICGAFDNSPKFLAMYSGTIGYAFPVEKILDVASFLKQNKEIGFVFLGDGQRLEEFKKISVDQKLNCLFLGRLNKTDVHSICRAIDFCLYPGKEGRFSSAILGNKVFDYLGAEKPIFYIGPDSAIADLILELKAGFIFESSEAEQLADKIEKCIINPDLLKISSNNSSIGFRDAGYTAVDSAKKLKSLIDIVLKP